MALGPELLHRPRAAASVRCVADASARDEDRWDEVLYYFDWWDCPRCGVTLVDGLPMHFESPFDEQLDDYVPAYFLWPMAAEDLATAEEVWREFEAWRARFDGGEQPPPIEETEAGRRLRSWRHEPPASARRAVPEWRLDADRLFAERTPRHKVRWQFLGDVPGDA